MAESIDVLGEIINRSVLINKQKRDNRQPVDPELLKNASVGFSKTYRSVYGVSPIECPTDIKIMLFMRWLSQAVESSYEGWTNPRYKLRGRISASVCPWKWFIKRLARGY